jgi:hypothetical protein
MHQNPTPLVALNNNFTLPVLAGRSGDYDTTAQTKTLPKKQTNRRPAKKLEEKVKAVHKERLEDCKEINVLKYVTKKPSCQKTVPRFIQSCSKDCQTGRQWQ